MISHRFSVIIIVQVLLLSATVYLVFWSLNQDYLKFTVFGFAGISLLQISLIIYSVTKNNKNINAFLNGFIINDDIPKFKNTYQEKSFINIRDNLDRISESYKKVKYEKESEHHFLKNIIEHIGTGILAFEESGNLCLSNDSLLSLLGLKHLNYITQLDDKISGISETIKSMKNNIPKLIKLFENGELIQLSVKASDMVINQKKIRLVSFQNISRELAFEEVNNWQKLISILRHEIMNSVTPITTVASTLIDDIEENLNIEANETINRKIIETNYKGLQAIRKRGEGLTDFVGKYKKVSNIPKPVISNFLIIDMLSEISTLMDNELKSSEIELGTELNNDSMELNADESLISQVLINLIRNSIRALSEVKENLIIVKGYNTPDNSCIIEVIDHGPGIPEDVMDQIFTPFYSSNKDGSGIGLSISRQIMKIHGGSITVLSEPYVKTIFSLRF